MTESSTDDGARPIVVGVGLTDESQYVLAKVAGLLGSADRIIAVHVEEPPPMLAYAAAEAIVALEDGAAALRAEARAQLAKLCDPLGITNSLVVSGRPAPTLHKVAVENNARAIAVGSHGHHGWRAMLGETANSVLHGAPCDVLAIMSRDHATHPSTTYEKLLIAVDLTDDADTVIKGALAIRDRFNAEVSLVSVIAPISHAYPGFDLPLSNDVVSSFQHATESQYRDNLTALAKKYGIKKFETRDGSLTGEIHRAVEEQEADLVVIGSHARHGLGLIAGSTPNDVLHGLTCDLLAVHL